MSINNGGPAFARSYGGHPGTHTDDPKTQPQDGMNLRDYLAARAMPAVLVTVRNDMKGELRHVSVRDDAFRREVAEQAYLMADAMLQARGQS